MSGLRDDGASTYGPMVHRFGHVRPDEWDVPFYAFTILRATDVDGREHIFEVPTAALRATDVPSEPCQPKSGDRWLCEAHGGYFGGRASGGATCSAARAADAGLREAELLVKADAVIAGHTRNLNGCRECGQLWPCHAVLLAWDVRRAAATPAPSGDEAGS